MFSRAARGRHAIACSVEQAFRVVEDDPHARVDQVVGDLLRSTRRHRQHAYNVVLVAHDVLPESSGALRGLTKTRAVKPANRFFGQIRTLELRKSARFVQNWLICISPSNAQPRACLRRNRAKPRKAQSGFDSRCPLILPMKIARKLRVDYNTSTGVHV